jgi:hypothetical protein
VAGSVAAQPDFRRRGLVDDGKGKMGFQLLILSLNGRASAGCKLAKTQRFKTNNGKLEL